ncbi:MULTISPECIES: thioesterase II family protein [Micromonospora]|uniref:Surfactin synthase thioesterase subunit n=1 Tax=Micromonospora yangpuensis TaxID=683228 RepID=A0A1C6UNR5_9ACTN|nr:alpha/beta fold hydrolase [Micromonospora yangpuensis]SCL55652.1 Surfactin synthase thioesterase subunit [Micromonospora yangpuensis]
MDPVQIDPTDARTDHQPAPAPDDVVWVLDSDAPGHRTSLLVLPHAGGNAHAYAGWRDLLPTHVRLLIGQYPGRGARFTEPLPERMADLVDPILASLPTDTTDLVVLGHSMGSLVAYEVTRALTTAGRAPRALIASACRAPFLPNPSPVHPARLDDDELVSAIQARGGTDDGILDEPELRELLLPSIRADFALDDAYQATPAAALTCPVTVVGGDVDPVVPAEALHRWAEVTGARVTTRVLPGGHFYFQQQLAAFLSLVTDVIDGDLVRTEAA